MVIEMKIELTLDEALARANMSYKKWYAEKFLQMKLEFKE